MLLKHNQKKWKDLMFIKIKTLLSGFGYIIVVFFIFIVWEVIFLGQMPSSR